MKDSFGGEMSTPVFKSKLFTYYKNAWSTSTKSFITVDYSNGLIFTKVMFEVHRVFGRVVIDFMYKKIYLRIIIRYKL